MNRLKFLLEYNCLPVWVYYGNELVKNGLPHKLSDDRELAELLKRISEVYNSRFINTPVEFSYKGFPDKQEEQAFDDMLRKAIEMLRNAAGSDYVVEVDPALERELY